MARQAEATRAAVLSLGVLAGFSLGIFLYMLSYVLIWRGVAHLLDGLFAAAMQAVIFPIAFLLLWTWRRTTAALCCALLCKLRVCFFVRPESARFSEC